MNWSKDKKFIAGLVILAIMLYVGLQNLPHVMNWVSWLAGLLSPFVLGACIAFIINVPMRSIETHLFRPDKTKKPIVKKLARPLSLVLTLVLVVTVLILIMFTIVPELVKTIGSLMVNGPAFFNRVGKWAEGISAQYPQIEDVIKSLEINWQEVWKQGLSFLQHGAGAILNSTFGVASSVINGMVKFFLGFVFALYVLLQKEKLAKQGKQLMYSFIKTEKVDRILEILTMANKTFSNFLSGQCVEAVILGTMFFIALTIFGFPYAMLIGVLIAFTALIPVFGAFIGCVVGAFLILVSNPVQAFWFVILFLVLQQIEGNLIYPHVVGGSVGLPSIWVLVAVTLGGSLMGVAGMLVFIPLCSVVYALLRGVVYHRLKEKKVPVEKWKE